MTVDAVPNLIAALDLLALFLITGAGLMVGGLVYAILDQSSGDSGNAADE